MTPDDPHRPRPDGSGSGPTEVDELASALLDGALGEAEAAEARQRPDVVARAGEMEAARGALRSGVPAPPPEARDRALDAALAAFDEAGTPPGTPLSAGDVGDSGEHDVADLAARRSSRFGPAGPSGPSGPSAHDARRRGMPRWLGAAAAVAAVLAGVAGLAVVSSGGSDEDETADMGAATAQEDAEAPPSDGDDAESDELGGETQAEAPEAGGDFDAGEATPSPLTPVEAGDLGSFASIDDLVDRAGGLVDDPGDAAVVTPELAARSSADALDRLGPVCVGGLPDSLTDPAAPLRLHATARVAGQPVDLWSTDGPDGRRLVVLAADCTVVTDRPVG